MDRRNMFLVTSRMISYPNNMRILILWILVSIAQVAHISGEVYVVNNSTENILECISEDDGNALVWNDYSQNGGFQVPDFSPVNQIGPIDCDGTQCWSKWLEFNDGGWMEMNSLTQSMGPVFDSRWEGFKEYKFINRSRTVLAQHLPLNFDIFISIRSSANVYFEFESQMDPEIEQGFRYIIRIESNITEVTQIWQHNMNTTTKEWGPQIQSDETTKDNLLSSEEWRTFMIRQNYDSKQIQLFTVSEKPELIWEEKVIFQVPNQTVKLHTYAYRIQDENPTRIRVHEYHYVYTNDSGKSLRSKTINLPPGTPLFVRMLIAMCETCGMDIKLVTRGGETPIGGDTVWEENMNQKVVPTWRIVSINYTMTTGGEVDLLIKSLRRAGHTDHNKYWALGSVHQYHSSGKVKRLPLSIPTSASNNRSSWEVTCQKFSEHGSVVVRPNLPVTFNEDLKIDFENCSGHALRPQCIINCRQPNANSCGGKIICQKQGCTCPPGFVGNDCAKSCEDGTYGYNCTAKCSHCSGKCDSNTGRCIEGSNNTDNVYIPPYCKQAVDEIPPLELEPGFNSVNVKISSMPANWAGVSQFYRFEYKETEMEGNTETLNGGINRENMKALETHIHGLKAGTNYSIYCEVGDGKTYWKKGPVTTFVTPCEDFDFQITPSVNRADLTRKDVFEVLHACPVEKNYTYEFLTLGSTKNPEKGQLGVKKTFKELSPLEEYQIIVRKDGEETFNAKFETLERKKTIIKNLSVTNITDTRAILTWERPKRIEGTPYYAIAYELLYFEGCGQAQNITSNSTFSNVNEKQFSLEELNPYASYKATVRACNKGCGVPVSTVFETLSTALPTTSFLDPKFDKTSNSLSWEKPHCLSMTGPIKAATIIIEGVSDHLKKNPPINLSTTAHVYDLSSLVYGGEKYEGRLYPKRNPTAQYNESVFTKFYFETLPKAPPQVRDLDVWEIDENKTIANIKWKPPLKPSGGELEEYTVEVEYANKSHMNPNISHFSGTSVSLWTEFICVPIKLLDFENQVTVKAKNRDVTAMGDGTSYKISQKDFKGKRSTPPKDVKIEFLEFGVTQISWSFPDKTFTPIDKFVIEVRFSRSNLRWIPSVPGDSISWSPHECQSTHQHKNPSKFLKRNSRTTNSTSKAIWMIRTVSSRSANYQYQHHYYANLTLLPSTDFNIILYALHESRLNGREVNNSTRIPSSLSFDGVLKGTVDNGNLTISLAIPNVVNDTCNSKMFVILISLYSCVSHSKMDARIREKIGVSPPQYAWLISESETHRLAGKNMTIGKDVQTNCPLRRNSSYLIKIIIDSGESRFINQSIELKFDESQNISEISGKKLALLIVSVVCFIAAVVVAIGLLLIYFKAN